MTTFTLEEQFRKFAEAPDTGEVRSYADCQARREVAVERFAESVKEYQRAHTELGKVEAALTAARNSKSPNAKKIEALEENAEALREVAAVSRRSVILARAAEETMRAMPEAIAGDEAAMRWTLNAAVGVSAYLKKLDFDAGEELHNLLVSIGIKVPGDLPGTWVSAVSLRVGAASK